MYIFTMYSAIHAGLSTGFSVGETANLAIDKDFIKHIVLDVACKKHAIKHLNKPVNMGTTLNTLRILGWKNS
jgi:hypothetical protein